MFRQRVANTKTVLAVGFVVSLVIISTAPIPVSAGDGINDIRWTSTDQFDIYDIDNTSIYIAEGPPDMISRANPVSETTSVQSNIDPVAITGGESGYTQGGEESGYAKTQAPVAKFNHSVPLQKLVDYRFVLTGEDTGWRMTVQLSPDSVGNTTVSSVLFFVLDGDGSVRSNPEVNIGSKYIPVSVSLSGTIGTNRVENVRVALIDPDTDQIVAETDPTPITIGYNGTLRQNATEGRIEVALPRKRLSKSTEAEMWIYNRTAEANNPSKIEAVADKVKLDLRYTPSHDAFVGTFAADALRGGRYDWRIALTFPDGGGFNRWVLGEVNRQVVVDTGPTDRSVSNCTTITSAGNYELTTDIDRRQSATRNCIVVTANNVTIDGNGHTLRGAGGWEYRVGVLVDRPNPLISNTISNVTVRNLTVDGWRTGVLFQDVRRGQMTDVLLTNTTQTIELTNTSGVVVPIVGGNTPTDQDEDGKYEDITGDGNVNILDVGALLQNRNSNAVQTNPDKFDFTGDGTVNILDVGKLLQQVVGG